MRSWIILVCIIIILEIWTGGLLSGKIPSRESDALRSLFNNADGKNWIKQDNWQGPPGTENQWYGITCDAQNTTVLKIRLRNNNLVGTLPADLGNLSHIKALVLSSNRIRDVHRSLGKLSTLTTLDLSDNQLSGEIPPWIGKLKNLKKLDLSYNRFTGSIPAWISQLENLEELRLDGNRLSGPLPQELGKLSRLKVLGLGHNRLVGEIPFPIGQLTQLSDHGSNFKWNGLYTFDDALRTFLNRKQSGNDWESTQTAPPLEITAESPSTTSLIIEWQPIAYKEDSGGYRVFYHEQPGVPYQLAGITEDKNITGMEIKDLAPSTTYYFVVQSWTAPHGSNRNSIESEYSKEITATTRGTTLAGTVKTEAGQGVAGVEITTSLQGGKAFTDSNGKYFLSVSPGWSGTVTPFKKGYDFTPPKLEYNRVESDRSGQDFRAGANTKITGQVIDSKGNGVAGVTLTFYDREGKTFARSKTGKGGNYLQIVSYDWTGTVIPSKTGLQFQPASLGYSGVTSLEAGNVYKARMLPAIAGRVKNGRGIGLPGVSLVFSPGEKVTPGTFTLASGEKGEYHKTFKKDWSGRVKPSAPGYKFYPAAREYPNMTLDTVKNTENYRAQLDLAFFILVTGNYMIPAEEGFADIYGSGMIFPEITVGYRFHREFYIWGGYGFASKSGTEPVFQEPASWKQGFLSLGLGYYRDLSFRFGFKFDLGVLLANYSEQAFGLYEPGKAIGGRIRCAGIFKVSDRLFTEISLGYLFASDHPVIGDVEIPVKLGGLKSGLGLGFRF